MRLLTAILISWVAAPAGAQIAWLNPVSGNWNDAGNWAGGNVPDTVGEIADISVAGTYVVELNLSPTIGGLTLTNPLATLNVQNGRTLSIGGPSFTNDGLILINSTAGASATALRTSVAAATIDGTGVIRLNASAANTATALLSTSLATNVLSIDAAQTVTGTGQIQVSVVNDGVIDADSAGNTLVLNSQPKVNNNLMQATDGGILEIDPITVTNAGGHILADGAGSAVVFDGATITGGSISAINGAVAEIASGTTTISDATLAGTIHVENGNTLSVTGAGLTNDGQITINPSAGVSGTALRTSVAAATIDGSGVIRLNASPANTGTALLNASLGTNVLTIAATQTVAGTGQISVNAVNNGVIDADSPGNTLLLNTQPKTNNNVMQATNGGTLEIDPITVTNGGGQVVADGAGSTLVLDGATIEGGSVLAINGAVATVTSGTTTMMDVSLAGEVHVVNGNALSVTGAGLTNNGEIVVNPTAGPSGTSLRTSTASALLDGTGTIRLNASPANTGTALLNASIGANVLTLGAGQTVAGTGQISVNTVNNGVIDADSAGNTLILNTQPKTNNNVMRATNGGTLEIDPVTVTNGSGQIVADGVGSAIVLDGATIEGGSVSAINGAVATVTSGTTTMMDVSLAGPIHVVNGNALSVTGAGLTNNGEIVVNPTSGASSTVLRITAAMATIGGAGTIRLNAGANPGTAIVAPSLATNQLILGSDQTLAGTGRVSVDTLVHGTLSPGSGLSGVGRLEQSAADVTLSPSATYEVDLTGLAAGEFDVYAVPSGTLALDGTLAVRVAVGFIPALGDEFEIMTHVTRTGRFEQVVAPDPGAGNAWRVRYEASRTVLTVTCPSDFNGDHVVSLDDLAVLLTNFGTLSGAHDYEGDLDGDGDVDLADLATLLAAFGTTCP